MTTKIKASVIGYITAMTATSITLSNDPVNTPNTGTLKFGNGANLKLTGGDGNNFTFAGAPLVLSDTSEITVGTLGSGALQVSGGVSISKKLQVAGNTKISSTTDITQGDDTTGSFINSGGATLKGKVQITDTSGFVNSSNKGALIVSGAGSFDKDLRAGQGSTGVNATRYIQVDNVYNAIDGNAVAATISAKAGGGGGYALMQSIGGYSSTDPATVRFAGYATNGVRIIDAIGDNIKFGVQPNHENGNYSVVIKTYNTAATSKTAGGTLQVTGDAAISGAVYTGDVHGAAFSGSSLYVTGNVTADGDVIGFNSSDARLKTDVEKITGALDKLTTLDGITFRWNGIDTDKNTEKREAGIIAQQVQQVLPEIVMEKTNGYLGVRYEQLIPLLIEAIKELDEKVKRLEGRA